ncbi:MAG TPA: hypothetical protein PLV45_04975 [bacterium]|nr:hypothetical protein [bacterium]
MKNYITLIVFLVLGMILGAWWPQSELQIARTRIDELKQELASRSRRTLIPDMARMMAMSEPRAARSVPSADPEPTPEIQPASDRKTPTPAPTVSQVEKTPRPPGEEFAEEMSRALEDAESADDALETMADLWRTRREMARTALADYLGLSDTEMEEFDARMATMNDTLADRFENLADRFAEMGMETEPTTEDAFRMAHDFTGVFVDTYDSLDETLPPGWRENGPDLDLTAFIDPYVFKPMMDMDFEENWADE